MFLVHASEPNDDPSDGRRRDVCRAARQYRLRHPRDGDDEDQRRDGQGRAEGLLREREIFFLRVLVLGRSLGRALATRSPEHFFDAVGRALRALRRRRREREALDVEA